ncbi:hypothetical protein bsdtb5_29750 [Anaeromicropila herbilytica]|uniref:Uncharacterized protein n=1 Tax=Anaeromicropila herbilytica TaxID=2785025 RepID=A0A7R7EMN5_9FIRM|nr:hypothetical protein bsdtb5_29750 [Anaeromicropila herbilytica]
MQQCNYDKGLLTLDEFCSCFGIGKCRAKDVNHYFDNDNVIIRLPIYQKYQIISGLRMNSLFRR